jgi:hypothetical protein
MLVDTRFVRFALDEDVVARCIYRNFPHQVTSTGVSVSRKVIAELELMLSRFNTFVGVEQTPYYRIDAYFDAGTLYILEINAAFVDGWGTALNLARASGIVVPKQKLVFPRLFATREQDYLPELELWRDELAQLGLNQHLIVDWQESLSEPVYVYGRGEGVANSFSFPYDGRRIDDKQNLALFSRKWSGQHVRIPKHYISRYHSWEDVPSEAVMKFCDKQSSESQQARTSVLIGKPQGKAAFLRSCYAAETLLAQEFIQPIIYEGQSTQLIILAVGSTPITGYVQYSQKKVINDNSVHGPLLLDA